MSDQSGQSDLPALLKELLSAQILAVLGTQSGGEPYGSLVAFASTDDLKHLVFATTRATRKYSNLMKSPLVSLVIDNRTNRDEDFRRAMAVTVMGTVEEVGSRERDRFLGLYLAKHPKLVDFATSSTCALLRVEVKVYYIVSHFQKVMEFRP
jgi:nitroimidazol reductase NimA-like FMN-containing flavoprotein (pyridoxamine 5'-phosphate oxidase superfamily)